MSEKLFENLRDVVSNDESTITSIESLCMNCGRNGITKLLPTQIPYFREVVIISFECKHCGHANNELQSAQQIDEKGVRFVVRCDSVKDLSRQVVKTEWANITIPELEFQVSKQISLITTIEGIIDRAINGLQQTFTNDNKDSETSKKILDFIVKLNELKLGNKSFTFILTDISGNSYVENPFAPQSDPSAQCVRFTRSDEEDKILCIYEPQSQSSLESNNLNEEVLEFATNCANCRSPCMTNMKLTSIPHFKQIVIMATNCDSCGHKTTEVKSGAGIEEKGVRITLKVNDENDLKKEVVQSDTCTVKIVELDIEIPSSGSGRYTTIEGLAQNMIEDLKISNPFIDGDSSVQEMKAKLSVICEKLSNIIGYTIILDDPCGNTFVEDVSDVVKYDRSWQQNEDLGLNDIKTDNY